jgi:hypothetical protein
MAYDFPTAPTNGQIANGYAWNGYAWAKQAGGGLDQATADVRYVNAAGDTMSGTLTVPALKGSGLNLLYQADQHLLQDAAATVNRLQVNATSAVVNLTTASGSSTTGALTVAGGVGIGHRLSFADGNGLQWGTAATAILGSAASNNIDFWTGSGLRARIDGATFQVIGPWAALILNKPAGGSGAQILGYTNSAYRWQMYLGDSTAESGGNAGSNFGLANYSDTGAYLGTAMGINRSNGSAYFSSATVSTSSSTGALVIAGGLGVGGAINAGGNVNSWGKTDFGLQNDGTNRYCLFAAGYAVYFENGTGNVITMSNSKPSFRAQPDGNLLCYTQAYIPGGGPWRDNSDARIKNVEDDYRHGLDEVAQLRPVVYTFKGNDTNDLNSPSPHKGITRKFIGLVAQEAETALPETVNKRAGYIDGEAVDDLRDLDTGPLIFALINSVKELKARVEQLEGPH